LSVGACAVDPATTSVEQSMYVGDPCPPGYCPGNSGDVQRGRMFWELEATGREASSSGLHFQQMERGGVSYGVQVDGDHMFLVRSGRRYPVETDTLLVIGDRLEEFRYRVAEVTTVPSLVDRSRTIPAYRFVTEEGASDLCPNHGELADPGAPAALAIVFAGDRYDPKYNTVTDVGDAVGTWFNIVCIQTPMAKLHRLGFTEASTGKATTQDERTAMYKMLTADYCGDGISYTETGQPLLFQDTRGRLPRIRYSPSSFEAVWTSQGALCLDHPRRGDSQLPAIRAHCAPPPCQSKLDLWIEQSAAVSANVGLRQL
jgi:hypothetical protein